MLKFKSKKLVALCCAIALISTFAISAFAATGPFSFSLDPNVNYGVAYSSNQSKDDNEGIAYVTPTSGNLISGDILYFAVATPGSNHTRISGYAGGSNVQYNVTYHPAYDSGENIAGRTACLMGDTDRYIVSVSGRWTP